MKRSTVMVVLAAFLMTCPGFFFPDVVRGADPVIIGVPTSLYTPFGSYGLKAVNLAVEEINAKGGGQGW
ncbi:MAG: hypothetical protein CVU64_09510 [Deltaproteobacteria bacterium HGW-Deltaproteobacteria-21]|nr:MAG: hypothetical protein CVU64_09510 [Deltaproteobacteria bacterium HGW-Deltaproteobacteria-21]